MTNCVSELQTDGGTQCFPLYLYDIEDHDDEEGKATSSRPTGAPQQAGLFSEHVEDLFEAAEATSPSPPPSFSKTSKRRHAITDAGLAHFQSAYPNESITKEDVFYYVYGLLHSRDYREKYADNLSKELPRIPCVSTAADFWAFTKAGRALANLHLNYESVEPYAATVQGDTGLSPEQYRVEKMRYGKKGKDKDLSVIHYNALISVSGIPLDAYEYVVIVVQVEVARQFFSGKRVWVAAVAFPLRRGQEADRHGSKRFGAEGSRRDDARAPNAAALQQPGAAVARHQVVGLAAQGHRQQERIVRIIRPDAIRQRRQLRQNDGALHVVDHRADAVRGQDGLELGVATHPPQLVELCRRCHQLKARRAPSAIDRIG